MKLGFTEYLTGLNSPTPSTLPQSIAELEDTSTLFLKHWQRSDYERASEVSKRAMTHLDFIANEFLRKKVGRRGHSSYQNSSFKTEMDVTCGNGVTGVTLPEQAAMVASGPGNGRIPANVGIVAVLTFDRLLNKIKHRSKILMNFRIDAGEHAFLICPENTNGGAEGIYEFNVENFCRRCSAAAARL